MLRQKTIVKILFDIYEILISRVNEDTTSMIIIHVPEPPT